MAQYDEHDEHAKVYSQQVAFTLQPPTLRYQIQATLSMRLVWNVSHRVATPDEGFVSAAQNASKCRMHLHVPCNYMQSAVRCAASAASVRLVLRLLRYRLLRSLPTLRPENDLATAAPVDRVQVVHCQLEKVP